MYLMVLPVATEIDYILRLWLGDNVPEYTNYFSILILAIALIDIYNWPTSIMIYASGKIKKYNITTGLIGLLVLPISYCGLRLGYSPIFVYFVSLFISIVVQIQSMYILQETTQISLKEYTRNIILPTMGLVACTCLAPSLLLFILPSSFLRLTAVTIVSTTIIGIVGYYFILTQNERGQIREIIQKKLHRS